MTAAVETRRMASEGAVRPAEDDLVDLTNAAALLGVTSATLGNWKARYSTFPKPEQLPFVSHNLWRWSDLESWVQTHRRNLPS